MTTGQTTPSDATTPTGAVAPIGATTSVGAGLPAARPGPPHRITVLSGGVGGARFTRSLRELLRREHAGGTAPSEITVVVNTGDDMWLHGVRVCPDLDTQMYTLGGAVSEEQGWGRRDESSRTSADLAAYGLGWEWFTLGDLDLATHLARTELLAAGLPLSTVTERLCARWRPGVRLLPMSDQEVETHVVVDDGDGRRSIHFEEWWVRHRAALPAVRFEQSGVAEARPAAGVLEAIADADLIIVPPSNPVVSVGTILGVPGIADALRAATAPIVGVSPVIAGQAVRGMAESCLRTIGVEASATAIARHYQDEYGILDGWLVDLADGDAVAELTAAGVAARAVPLWMSDAATGEALAAEVLALGAQLASAGSAPLR
ncbi:2-phospho-L-lactate transferase [Mycetocola reblochoni]|uniref:Lactyl (2) diphospho-(5')guanosine:7,8-didemethyl-8-hydroxy-5-deazariboflavin 2-phospho-L-lactate transferase n=2 Tax=Mycetocola reblochoni TaxID=331618 RepID=A0A1R4IUV8_9MICO|nr:2-phospho-L-lactate transferase [Mycetocola reblochoni]RLP71036.1 2-phospho-L-lactate transferase [Mycetocola reblochoni]SJN23365.1 Lactyl (2) diphospho-(5')guanosine:7,8-didemethyl-8-hydroxy-5-deazariboflavin 2-phospho-L-lactate transferase [Mycetocola reblochoni REB411]